MFALFCSSCQADKTGEANLTATTETTSEQPYIPIFAPNSNEFAQQLPSSVCTLGSSKIKVLLARTPFQRAKGMMFAESLADNEGMLFIYNSPQKMVFWMKNTKIPLDIVFLSPSLQIIEWIEGMEPGYGKSEYKLPRYEAKQLAQYALELNSGAVKKMGLQLGDKLEIPLTLLYSE